MSLKQTILIFSCLMFSLSSYGQENLCANTYLWDFKTVNDERNFVTERLSNEVEDILSQIAECKIIQRRRYAEIQRQVDNEVQISNVEGISYDLISQLKTIQAEHVLFGVVEQDFSFNVSLRLRLEHLQTKQIKTATILIPADKMIDPELRVRVIKTGISDLLGIQSTNTLTQKTNSYTAQVVNIEGHKIELDRCAIEGTNLKCYLYITSLGKDRKIYLMADYYQGETTVVDQYGTTKTATSVKLGDYFSQSHIYQKDLYSGVRTPLEYTFEDFNVNSSAVNILKIDLHTEELQFTEAIFRNIELR